MAAVEAPAPAAQYRRDFTMLIWDGVKAWAPIRWLDTAEDLEAERDDLTVFARDLELAIEQRRRRLVELIAELKEERRVDCREAAERFTARPTLALRRELDRLAGELVALDAQEDELDGQPIEWENPLDGLSVRSCLPEEVLELLHPLGGGLNCSPNAPIETRERMLAETSLDLLETALDQTRANLERLAAVAR